MTLKIDRKKYIYKRKMSEPIKGVDRSISEQNVKIMPWHLK